MVKSGEEVLWRKPPRGERQREGASERREKEIVERLIKKERKFDSNNMRE